MGFVFASTPGRAGHAAGSRRRLPLEAAWLGAAVALIAAAAPPALAQEAAAPPDSADASPDVVEARASFQAGISLANEDRWADALQAFERSEALRPHAITTYNIGYCERLLGHWTRANKMLRRALVEDQTQGGGHLPAGLLHATQTYLSEAARQIGRVVVTSAPGAVTVDGRPLELASTTGPRPVLLAGTRPVGDAESPPALTFEVQVDPGTHVFVLSSKGQPDVVVNETSAPGSESALALRPSSDATAPRAEGAPDASPSTGGRSHVPGFVVLGVGGAALTAGVISGLAAFHFKNTVHTVCSAPDSADACASEREAGHRAADISTISFIAGGVGIGVGAALLAIASGKTTARSAAAPSTQTPEVRPVIGWGTLGLDGRF